MRAVPPKVSPELIRRVASIIGADDEIGKLNARTIAEEVISYLTSSEIVPEKAVAATRKTSKRSMKRLRSSAT